VLTVEAEVDFSAQKTRIIRHRNRCFSLLVFYFSHPGGAMGLDSSEFKLNSSLGNYSKSYNEITNLIRFASRFIPWLVSQI